MPLIDKYETFEEESLKVLNKFIRANHAPYMTKNLRKAIKKKESKKLCSQLDIKNIKDNITDKLQILYRIHLIIF